LEQHGPRLIQTVRGLGYVMRLNGRSPSYQHRVLAQPSLF
jgi:hypothetical protein